MNLLRRSTFAVRPESEHYVSTNSNQLKSIIEAALFSSETPLSVAKLISLFPHDGAPSRDEIRAVLDELGQDYAERGIQLKRVGKAYRFQSCEKFSPWLRKLNEERLPRYGRALLETLAIIAYRQPVTRGDIEEIRGVTVSTETMRTLLNREWVKQVGQREVAGRPALFGTTQRFLEHFNLVSLSELPPLMEKREPAAIARELNLRLPLEEVGASTDGDMFISDLTDDAVEQPTAEIIHLDSVGDQAYGGDDERETS